MQPPTGRRIRRTVATLIVLVAPSVTWELASAQERPRSPSPEIRTSASASRNVPADLAVVTLELTGRGSTITAAAREAAKLGNQVRRAMAAAGVPADSLSSRGFVSYSWDERSLMEIKPNPAGYGRMDTLYGFRDVIVARIHELKRIGQVIDTAIASGAQKMTSMQFIATRTDAASLEALTEATRLVRQQAEVMAKAAGGKLGQVIELSTNPGNWGGFEVSSLAAMNMRGDQATLTVKPATVDLRVTVYARWALLPSP